jgi:ribosome-binding ATPase
MLIGVIGKPSVGKSTFFKAATLAEVEIASYPFTTIKPNTAVAYVKVKCADKEFNVQCNPREGYCLDGWRFVPVQLMDVAGLVPGAHEGKGMGSEFLDDLRQADVLIHVVDISGSTNEKGEQIEPGSHNPAKDIEFLEHELDMWYLNILNKTWDKFARQASQENIEAKKAIAKQFSGLGGVTEELVEKLMNRLQLKEKRIKSWTEEDVKNFAIAIRKTTKPIILACNKIDTETASNNLQKIKESHKEDIIIPCSAESELALREAAKNELIDYIPGEKTFTIKQPEKLSEKQNKALDFIKTDILEKYDSTGVQQVLDTAVFNLLKYVAIFPGGVNNLADKKGNVMPDCFLLPPNSTALNFAFHIHTDIGNKFVKAIDVRKKVPIGKNQLLKNMDVIEIKTSA